MIPAWIKSTDAWRAQGGEWHAVPHLIASERIAAGVSLSKPGTLEELHLFLEHVRDTIPASQIGVVRRCPVIDQPIVALHPPNESLYYRKAPSFFSVPLDRVSLYYNLGSHILPKELPEISTHLWSLLGVHLEQCHFGFEGGVYCLLEGQELEDEIAAQSA